MTITRPTGASRMWPSRGPAHLHPAEVSDLGPPILILSMSAGGARRAVAAVRYLGLTARLPPPTQPVPQRAPVRIVDEAVGGHRPGPGEEPHPFRAVGA